MEKMCKDCKNVKPISAFVKNQNCKDGYENICKPCKNIRRQTRYENHYKNINPLASGNKVCRKCHQNKDITSFTIDLKCVDGRRNICKSCTNNRIGKKREINKKEFNSVYWNRKADSVNYRVRVNTINGISGTELEKLYNSQNKKCAYCNVNIDKTFHIDHKIPISQGGIHDIENICFTCEDCNRLKHTRTDDEFKIFLQEYIKRFI